MPQSLQTLMQAAADMLAVERADLQSVVRGIEMGIRKQIKAKKAEERRKKTMGAAAKDVGPGEDEGMREEFEDADMAE